MLLPRRTIPLSLIEAEYNQPNGWLVQYQFTLPRSNIEDDLRNRSLPVQGLPIFEVNRNSGVALRDIFGMRMEIGLIFLDLCTDRRKFVSLKS